MKAFTRPRNILEVKNCEECVVNNVKLCGTFNTDSKKIACITLRVPVSSYKQTGINEIENNQN